VGEHVSYLRTLAAEERPRVLIFLDYFLPGENAGGPVRTVAALIHHLGARAAFQVVTRNHDLGDDTPYQLSTVAWVEHGGARCRYLKRTDRSPWRIAKILRDTPHDVLYVNGIFSIAFSLIPLGLRRCRLVPRRPVVVAPRGQLDPGALAINPVRKRAFLFAARLSGVYAGATWQATSEEEAHFIRRWFGPNVAMRLAPNLRIAKDVVRAGRREPSTPLRVVFLSRISPKKNLIGAVEILSHVRAQVVFDIYGIREDEQYWRRVERLLDALPANVRAEYRGVVPYSAVDEVLRTYDVLLLPTFGENYGHVIAEALAAGCAPLISDRTPWRDLAARGVGWDLPLEDRAGFTAVLEACADEGAEPRAARAAAGAGWVQAIDSDPRRVEANARLFGVARDSGEMALHTEAQWTTRAPR
jgi:glycosyltransferase involved in cell wall biosynthesis